MSTEKQLQCGASVFWRLRIRYYQYNDGRSNNGSFRRAITFSDETEAIRVRDAIQKAIETGGGKAHVGMDDGDPELPDYIPGGCGGFYTWVALFRVDEHESPLGQLCALTQPGEPTK